MHKSHVPHAIFWWADRFCHSAKAQEFLLQMVGLLPKTADKQARWSQYLDRNRRYSLQFVYSEATRDIAVIPTLPEATWATGVIGERDEKFEFLTVERPSMFREGRGTFDTLKFDGKPATVIILDDPSAMPDLTPDQEAALQEWVDHQLARLKER